MSSKTVSAEIISDKIYFIRGQKVMLASDLAKLYGVTTLRLNEQVKRNKNRFPSDFMFQLKKEEVMNLTSQFAISSWGGRRHLPYVFTEQGVAMLSSVLNSERAVEVNIIIMRTFVKIREVLTNHKELALKLNEIEQKLAKHDKEILAILQVIRRLITDEVKPKKKIGFHS